MIPIQKITVSSMVVDGGRVETGPVEFTYPNGQSDWPGVFIRGDNAAHYAMTIKNFLETCPDSLDKMILKGLASDLGECVLGPAGQMLRQEKPK